MSTKLGVSENFVSSLSLVIQSSTRLKKCIEHCLTALATLLHIIQYLYTFYVEKLKKLHASISGLVIGFLVTRELIAFISTKDIT